MVMLLSSHCHKLSWTIVSTGDRSVRKEAAGLWSSCSPPGLPTTPSLSALSPCSNRVFQIVAIHHYYLSMTQQSTPPAWPWLFIDIVSQQPNEMQIICSLDIVTIKTAFTFSSYYDGYGVDGQTINIATIIITRTQYSVAVIGSGVKDEGRETWEATAASAATWAMISYSMVMVIVTQDSVVHLAKLVSVN